MPAACRLARLPRLGAIRVTGADAADFLAAQLSQAPPGPGADRAPLAAWHDAKGRVQGLFRIVRRDDAYLLISHTSVLDEVTAALRRYVLRADVRLEVAGDAASAALLGDGDAWLADRRVELGTEPGAAAFERDIAWFRLGPTLVQALATASTLERLGADLPSGTEVDVELAKIRLGLPTVSAELRGRFLPQMLNLDVLGGLAFDKGCYPGQEVIARTQNLGTVKRRLLRFAGDTPTAPPVGGALSDSSGEPAGIVVRAAPTPNGIELLAVTRLDAVSDTLTLEEPAGVALRLEPLPYAVPGMAS